MKKIMTILVAVMLATLTGCDMFGHGAEPYKGTPHNVAVVNASNANSVWLDLEEVQPAIADVCKTGGYFTYVIADSDGYIAYHDTVQISADGLSEDTYNRRINSKAQEMTEKISSSYPKSEEVDLLKAISLAAKDLSRKENPAIIIYTTGLSTTGALDMSKLSSVEHIDISATVEKLNTLEAIPDLTGYDVQFCFTDVAGCQEKLSDKEEKIISELWQSIIEAGGGKFTQYYYLAQNTSVYEAAPFVTPVPVSGSQTGCVEITLDDIPEKLPTNFEITIDEESIAFVAGTARLKDEVSARNTLEPLANVIRSNNIDLLLVGSTATVGDAASSVTLSEERCQAIVGLLREAGVDSDIVIKGYGYDSSNPFYTNDLDGGVLIEERAALNRKVVIIDLNSEKARNILG